MCTWLIELFSNINDRIMNLIFSFSKWLKWTSISITFIFDMIFLSIFVMIFVVLFWFFIWTFIISIDTLNNAINVECRWIWFNSICTYECNVSFWFIVYLFFNICFHRIFRDICIAEFYWETKIDFNETSNIFKILIFHEFKCNYFTTKISRIRQNLFISKNDKNRLISMHKYICSHMSNFFHELFVYYRYVNIFSKSFFQQMNVIKKQIETTLTNNFSRNAFANQKSLKKKFVNIIST